MDRVSPREPAAWIAALRLGDSERHVLMMLVRPNPHEVADQLSELLSLMLRQATRAGSLGTQESAGPAVHESTLGAGASQSISALRLE